MDTKHPNRAVAEACWRLIKALLDQGEDRELNDDVAENLIEMACDSAVDAERVALGYPPHEVPLS